ncbi:hypothetical protein RUM43_011874 [Polyplax serrata]|uniref:Angiotensin-converting enzyme n=1 Tax=Polyplax serrata TaxID=468196 RepID=A0AAN8PJW5_POLSC
MAPLNFAWTIFSFFFMLQTKYVSCEDTTYVEGTNDSLEEALQFLREYDREASAMCTRLTMAQWNFSTNITMTNRRKMLTEQSLYDKFQRLSWRKAATFAWSRLPDPDVRRQMKKLTTEGRLALHDDQFKELKDIIDEMKEIYTKGTICPYNKNPVYCNQKLEPTLSKTMARSRDYHELLHVWKSWRDAVGPGIRQKYIRYVQLANQAARLSGFFDAGEQMRSVYDIPNFEDNLTELWNTVEPFYRELHAYVRRKLLQYYGSQYIRPDGPIPAHLLGNMWAQSWKNIEDLVLPYPGKTSGDVTPELLRQGYNPLRMFQVAEEFFISLGLKPMPPEFWRHSLLEKPVSREVVCRASAWDFCNRMDYRIKQCTEVVMEDFLTIHHEMAHIEYYLQYADQPYLYRAGANPAFHEAVGDVIGLSVQTPRHLQRIGLLNNITDDYETNINYLLSIALEKVVYLPFAYIVDKWRWSVFTEGVRNMNAKWWELRLNYQGLIPPILRSEDDFDPAAKYHVASDTPYIRYFLSVVMQFQLYESLCEASGHYGQLHTCDIYRSREAGRLLREVLQAGASRPWPDIVNIMSRGKTKKITANSLIQYFQPLITWLKVQNRKEAFVGWTTGPHDTALFADWYRSEGTTTSSGLSTYLLAFLLLTRWNQ